MKHVMSKWETATQPKSIELVLESYFFACLLATSGIDFLVLMTLFFLFLEFVRRVCLGLLGGAYALLIGLASR